MERLDPDQIYDPNLAASNSLLPKAKQLFKVSREHRFDTICKKLHRKSNHHLLLLKSKASRLDPIGPPPSSPSKEPRKCLTEVGQGPTQATSEPPLLIEEEDVDECRGGDGDRA